MELSDVPRSPSPSPVRLVCSFAMLFLAACSGSATGDGTGPAIAAEIPAGAKRVFVTSSTYTGNFAVALASANAPVGAASGDALCQLAAESAQLGGTFSAYLFDQSTLSNDRITAAGPWYGTDGTVVFNNKANLVTSPQSALRFDERGKLAYGAAWVGGAQDTCANWTKAEGTMAAAIGYVGAESQLWRQSTTARCDGNNHLYCFEK